MKNTKRLIDIILETVTPNTRACEKIISLRDEVEKRIGRKLTPNDVFHRIHSDVKQKATIYFIEYGQQKENTVICREDQLYRDRLN